VAELERGQRGTCPAGSACVSPYCAVHAQANGKANFERAKARAEAAYKASFDKNSAETNAAKRHANASAAALNAFHGRD